ncbi:hypothetical protein [Flavobacterium sp.]|uniref:hypothetical protein n=1 Tax=Flavobacterium sp. TaxID=239 RepID=UPI00261C386E|nr:hypothetical protein [Flavobacterium sp.]
MKNLIVMIFLVLFSSCSNDDKPTAANLDASVSIYLKDLENKNLINTSNFLSENYRIYHLIDGVSTEVYDTNMDNPRGFFINYETSPICMALTLNHSENEQFPITYVKWNETDTDTLKAQFDRGSENNVDYVVCQKLWLNDELVWDVTTPDGITGREITIVK